MMWRKILVMQKRLNKDHRKKNLKKWLDKNKIGYKLSVKEIWEKLRVYYKTILENAAVTNANTEKLMSSAIIDESHETKKLTSFIHHKAK